MRIRYFIESALQQDADGQFYFTPIGVWAHGPGLGMDIAMAYLPGYETAQAAAEGIITDLIERGARMLPPDFLEQQHPAIPLYRGDRSPIYTTEGSSAEGVAAQVVALIISGKPLGDPPLPLPQS
ncbi:MAG TPA: hypothetical protein VGL77_11740 [Armatimonadota bacterium]|jgi:hypothetical protein